MEAADHFQVVIHLDALVDQFQVKTGSGKGLSIYVRLDQPVAGDLQPVRPDHMQGRILQVAGLLHG